MDFEQIDEFEQELRQAMERRPAPPSLKRRILQQRRMRRTQRLQSRTMVAAAGGISGAGWLVAGGYSWRQVEERRKGEEARSRC